jgi:leucyl-tRNA synthetase
MSKSKKNTIDPETMIKQFGADSVRWFILSDSPPDKDIQWSEVGVSAANKFLQKIWNLNCIILEKKEGVANKKLDKKFIEEVNSFFYKIDNSIKHFRFNVSIALFYELYNYLNRNINSKISINTLKESTINLMKLMTPFTPHLARECLENLKCKSYNLWPSIDISKIMNRVKLAVQVNGKTRDIITVEKDKGEKDIKDIVLLQSKAKKYIENSDIKRTIFVKNKIINYILDKQ